MITGKRMRRAYTLIILCCLVVVCLGQTQQGVVYRYNGKKAKTPLGKVYIKVETAPNGVLSDSIKGTFTLHFSGLSMGSRIGNVQVQKRGMMIFNQQAVDEWNIRKEPLRLILCDADEFEKQKQRYVTIGYTEAKKRYDKRVADIEEKYLAIDRKHKSDSVEMYQKLNEAEKELRNVRKHLYEYADAMARIDQSELDNQMQEILDFYSQGEIEIAVQKLESLNLIETFDEHINRRVKIEQQVSNVNEDIEVLIGKMRAAVPVLQSKGKWAEVKQFLKRIANETNNINDCWDYANFCYDNGDFADAEEYYRKALSIMREREKNGTDSLLASCKLTESEMIGNIASVYSRTNRFAESENMYKKSINIIRNIKWPNPQGKPVILASFQLKLAQLYITIQRYKESEKLLKAIRSVLSKNPYAKNSPTFKTQLAEVSISLGNLFYYKEQYTKSENEYKKALEIYQSLSSDNLQDYECDVANTYYDLAVLYETNHKSRECEDYYKKALAIYVKWAEIKPLAYQDKLVLTLRSFREFLSEKGRIDKLEQQLEEEIRIYQQLAKSNSDIYAFHVILSQRVLAERYIDTERYTKADSLYQIALLYTTELAKERPDIYEKSLAFTYYRLGIVKFLNSRSLQEAQAALPSLLNATKHYNQELERDTTISRLHIDALKWVHRLSSWNQQYTSHYEISIQLVALLKKCYDMNPGQWEEQEYSSALSLLSRDLILLKRFKDAEQYALNSLSIKQTESTNVFIPLAFSLLFQGKFTEAKSIILKQKDNLTRSNTKVGYYYLNALSQFAEADIIPKECEADVEEIKRLLEE